MAICGDFEQLAKDNCFSFLFIVARSFPKDVFLGPLDISLDLTDKISG